MAVNSIILKSQLESIHRIDAEYYQPDYLQVEKKLNSIKTQIVDDISESVVNFGAYSLCNFIEFRESGVPYLNVNNILDGYIEYDDIKYIDDEVNEILKKSKVKEGQVIITMAGTIGHSAVAHKIPSKINSNQATAKITLKKEFSPYYLSAFLNSYYGRKQTEREIVSSVQPNIFLWQIKGFKVPVITKDKEKEIERIYISGLSSLELSKTLYSQAESLLLEELGLKDFKPEDELSYVVNLSEAKSVHRIDAEYFQPKFKKLESRILNLEHKRLGDLVTMKKGFEPGSEEYQNEGKLFIRVSSITKHGIIDKDQKYLTDVLYDELRNNFEPKVAEILLTKDATPGIAYVIKEPIEGIISSGILRLKLKDKNIENEYLALCLNSLVGKMQSERDGGGSIITHWKPDQIKNVLIPFISDAKQHKIADLVRQSHEARKKAKELLAEAKRKVEEEIEKGSS